MRKPTKALIAVLLVGAVSVNADVVRTRGGAAGISPGGVFVGQIVAPAADNCTAPPYSFSGDLNTGVCTSTADNLSLRTAGANQLTVNATTITSTVPYVAPAGAANGAAFRMTDTDTGFYEVSATNWGWAVNGTERVRLGSGGAITNTGGYSVGSTIGGVDTSFTRFAASVGAVTNGTQTSARFLLGGGSAVASAATLPAPTGSVFHVTGTTNITGGITATGLGTGVQITLIFDGILTVSSGGNLIIVGGTFVTTANDTLTLVYDGTNFFEIARTVL